MTTISSRPPWLWDACPARDQEIGGWHLHIRQHSFAEIDHEIFSTVIPSFLLNQEGLLSVSEDKPCPVKHFKTLLFKKHWINFNITWQKGPFGDPLPRVIKPWRFIKNVAARWRPGLFYLYTCIYKKTLRIFLSETTGAISILYGSNVSFVTFYRYFSNHHDLKKQNMVARSGACFPYLTILAEKRNCALVKSYTK